MPLRLSASQVQTFSDCQRKWAWRYVEGVEEPPSPAAELGRSVHGILESYLRGGEIDFSQETGYIAASGIEHLPKPGSPGLRVEEEFHFFGPSGHSYLGYKDVETPGVIYDHKTTSDLKWQKTAEDLKADVQATLYAVDYFRNHPEEREVELRWVYYQTRNTRKSAVTRLRVTQEEAWVRFLAIEQVAASMEVASQKRALDLPPTISHCSAYGGCPHQGRCNLSPFEKMRSHVEQNKLVNLLKNKNNNGAVAAVAAAAPAASVGQVPSRAFEPGGAFHGVLPGAPAAVPPAAAAAPPPAPVTGNALLMKMRAQGAPAAVAPAAAAAAAPAPSAAPVNPPEYQPPPAPPAAAMSVAEAGAELAAHLGNPPMVQALPAAAPAAAEPRGRGRPQKATLPATGVATKIKVLYVNCGPVGVEIADAGHLIVLAKRRIAAEARLADYRFAEFGQGPGLLAVAAVAELEALEGVVAAMRLDTTTPEGSILCVELMARADMVVR